MLLVAAFIALTISYLWATPAGIALILMLPLVLDNGLCMMGRQRASVQTLFSGGGVTQKEQLTVLLPGYNGNGQSMAATLRAAGAVQYTDLLYYTPTYNGFDVHAISLAIYNAIRQWKASGAHTGGTQQRIVIYGESLGGMQAVDLLRQFPDLHVDLLVLGAAPFNWRLTTLKSIIPASRVLEGGPILTQALRFKQRQDIRNAPEPERGLGSTVRDAHWASLRMTAVMLMDQLRYMLGYRSMDSGELLGRASGVVYVSSAGESDGLVLVRESEQLWGSAFTGTPFSTVHPQSWTGHHAPVTERPSPVVAILKDFATT